MDSSMSLLASVVLLTGTFVLAIRTKSTKLKRMDKSYTLKLRPWREFTLVDQLLSAMEDGSIAKHTLQIPHPYTAEDARSFLAMSKDWNHAYFIEVDGLFAGGLSFDQVSGPGRAHIYSVGYYLAPKFRGTGIMTQALGDAIKLFRSEKPDIKFLEASVFSFNGASGRVLEKNGFVGSSILPHYYCKNGTIFDAIRYVKKLGD